MVNLFSARMPRPFNGERTVSSTNDTEKTGYSHRKNKVEPLPKRQLKMDYRWKVRPKIIKLLEENRAKLHNIRFGSEFSDLTPKAQSMSPPATTEIMLWFANHVSDKWLISRIYRKLLKLKNKKTYNPIQKWTKDFNRNFS